jgi:hypothetical protein
MVPSAVAMLEHLIVCLHSALPDMRSQASIPGREFELAGVVYFCGDVRYTRVAKDGLEAHIRLSLRELADSLDPAAFWQIHRGYMVGRAAHRRRRARRRWRVVAAPTRAQGAAACQPALSAIVSWHVAASPTRRHHES